MPTLTTDSAVVSIIVCTRDRRASLRRALASVQRAIAAVPELAAEVIVVDDGDVPVAIGVDCGGSTLWIPGPRAGVGAARAAGLAAARGNLIAYCDDDDEWTPNHLAVLLGSLREQPAVALVHGDAAWRSTDDARAPSPPIRVPELGSAERIHASDVLHRAEAARDVGGFDPSLRAFEDIDLWLRMAEAHLMGHVPTVVSTHHRHPGCITAVEHPEEHDRLLRYHRRARPCRNHAIATGPRTASFDATTWQPPRRELLWHSPLNPYQGFGVAARELLLAVERAGVDVRLESAPGRAATDFDRFVKPPDGRERIGFSVEYWHRPETPPVGLQVVVTMREDTLVPKNRINALNQRASLVYLPCHQNLASFRASGLQVPSKVLPFGVNGDRFPFLERPRTGSEPFTFGTFGALSRRKGIDVLIRAFRAEFTRDEPVRLVLKSLDDLPLPDDPRIEVHTRFWSHDTLLSFLRRLDAFVLPSRAEGFGLCGLEAMATGLPLIATNWSGPADYLDPADSFPLAFQLVDAAATETNGVRYFGQWAEPEVEHLRGLLRQLYEHPDDARAKGRRASTRVHAAWTWDRVARQLREDLDLLAAGISPA